MNGAYVEQSAAKKGFLLPLLSKRFHGVEKYWLDASVESTYSSS